MSLFPLRWASYAFGLEKSNSSHHRTGKERVDDVSNCALKKFEKGKDQIETRYLDRNRLLKIESSTHLPLIPECKLQWFLNLALLNNLYTQTQDPQLKQMLSFLVQNYLGKAAPICPNDLNISQNLIDGLYKHLQLHLNEPGISYNRESSLFDSFINEKIREKITPAARGLVYLTDTKHFAKLLPLFFSLIETLPFLNQRKLEEANTSDMHKFYSQHGDSLEKLSNRWERSISEHVQRHFLTYPDDPFSTFIDFPLLVDLSQLLETAIFDFAQEEKIKYLESLLESAIDQVSSKLHPKNPDKLKAWIIANLTVICRNNLRKVDVLTVLPFFFHPKYLTFQEENPSLFGETKTSSEKLAHFILDSKISKSKAEITEFLNVSGLRLGAVAGRAKIFNFISLDQLLKQSNVQVPTYAPRGGNNLYFKEFSDLIQTSLFKRIEKSFSIAETTSPVYLLGSSVTQLLRGLANQISKTAWNQCISQPELREVVQTSLYKIHENLAMAELKRDDFVTFSQKIELIHYEMAALLAIFMPYHDSDFSKIYRHRLEMIPDALRRHVNAGLAKNAMEVFVGVNAALMEKPNPVRVIDPGSHFEIFQFMGENHCFQNVLQNPEIRKVDFYLGEFNHNVNLFSDQSTYHPGDVIQEIETLLSAKPETQYLTVAIDSTIDFINSEKAKELLKTFSQEILSGKLNFIFFRSGQKFDMLGMDHFYGSPFYMINNGASQWRPFKILTESETFHTDPLSYQWFCLINQYAPEKLDEYRNIIFKNTRNILQNVPKKLLPGKNPRIQVQQVSKKMETCFLDIKCSDDLVCKELENILYQTYLKNEAVIHSRGGYGYVNANINLFTKSKLGYTIRLNPGINPAENLLILEFLQKVVELVENYED